MPSELITVEYAGPASRQVGSIPCHDVRAWWRTGDDATVDNVKRAARAELRRHIKADHIEFVTMDMDTYSSPSVNAMLTFRVFTQAQLASRAELRARVYSTCDGCGCDHPGQVVRMDDGSAERALCHGCWHPIRDACKVLHWIKANGKLRV